MNIRPSSDQSTPTAEALGPEMYLGENALSSLQAWLKAQSYSKLFVLYDCNTFDACQRHTENILPDHHYHIMPAGETNKNLETCTDVWKWLTEQGADRQSLLLNIGGGVVCDLGGFCAATYKRGVRFVHVPTSLLAMVDASIGGKTGVDLFGYKNHIGVFAQPAAIFAYPPFLKTLPLEELRSGYVELLKHLLLADPDNWTTVKGHLPENIDLEALIPKAIAIKRKIAESDPLEKGARKLLNLGHTVAHAVESALLGTPDQVSHGQAVAIGLACESYISHRRGMLPEPELCEVMAALRPLFAKKLMAGHTDLIVSNCLQDKKNLGGKVNCTLLKKIGHAEYDVEVTVESIRESLIWYDGQK